MENQSNADANANVLPRRSNSMRYEEQLRIIEDEMIQNKIKNLPCSMVAPIIYIAIYYYLVHTSEGENCGLSSFISTKTLLRTNIWI